MFLIVLLIVSCKKDIGTMIYKGKFTADKMIVKQTNSDTLYSIFGDYITSITPYHLSGFVSMFMFQDIYTQTDPSSHMIAYVENTNIEVDFSGNDEVEFIPTLHSTDIMNGLFEQKETDFRFISFCSNAYKHGFEIPIQYLDLIQNSSIDFLQGSQFDYTSSPGKIKVLSTNVMLSYMAMHGNDNSKPYGFNVIFGNTDSSYLYIYNGVNLPESERFPFWDQSNIVNIRSSQYNTQKVIMPGDGETFTMYATLAFDTENLIQVYAGNDNLPYTKDDVFVYAPKFWDRIKIKLEMK